MKRVLIVASTRVYGQALAAKLLLMNEIASVATAPTVDDALEEAARSRPNAVLVDVPVSEGKRLVGGLQQSGLSDTHVLAYAVPELTHEILAWAAIGVSGCLTRDVDIEELVSAVVEVRDGDIRCSSAVARLLFRYIRNPNGSVTATENTAGLTPRQGEIARLLADGLSNKEIASVLSIEFPTVKNHVHQIFERLGIHKRAEVGEWFNLLSSASRAPGRLA